MPFTVPSKYIVCGVVAFFTNLVMMFICGTLTNIALFIVMPLNIYTADQFMNISVLLSLGVITLGNAFLIKAGLYRSIKNNFS